MLTYNKKLIPRSRSLRSSMTEAEVRLWARLKSGRLNNHIFYIQKIIGNYIADFYCHAVRLVIEVDGGQHNSSEGLKRDAERDAYLKSRGLTVLRFNDHEVLTNTDSVVLAIMNFTMDKNL